jgi:RNA polymerase sigma factor (sigma-70 family)
MVYTCGLDGLKERGKMKAKLADYYEDNYKDLFRIANSRVDNPADGEEVLSDAVVTMMRQIKNGKLSKEEDIPTYFTTCINSRAIDFKRKEDKHGVVDQDLESGLVMQQQFDNGLNPEQALEAAQEGETVSDKVNAVKNTNKRSILTKHILYGLKASVVAHETGFSHQYVNRVIKEFSV